MIEILKEELILAAGCTEPLAIAYASAIVRDNLGDKVDKLILNLSGNVIKNVNSVTIPNTDGAKGLKAACIAGFIAGDSKLLLEAIKDVEDSKKEEIKKNLDKIEVVINHAKDDAKLYISIEGIYKDNKVLVEIKHTHTNITKIEKNGKLIFENDCDNTSVDTVLADRSILNIEDIYKFAKEGNIDEVTALIESQIKCNYSIALEGMIGNYGCQIGKTIHNNTNDEMIKAIALAAAGSDARMSGSKLPVMTNNGSGNQGITLSVPIIYYARNNKYNNEELLRALVFANLINVYIKMGIGRLSSYCGAVCAGKSAFAGISFLEGRDVDFIKKVITNGLATDSGIICDGAKESCASKIATSLQSGLLAYQMAKKDLVFPNNCGIVKDNFEDTLDNVWTVAKDGMQVTDEVILNVMI